MIYARDWGTDASSAPTTSTLAAVTHSLLGRRILIVEDEPLVSLVLCDWLEEEQAKVVGPAASIEEASHLVDIGSLDAAILDVNVAGRTVFAVADLLAARGVPFLFTTGYDAAELPLRFADAAVLQKPFLIQHLAAALSRVMAAPRGV
jgi:DNA-binding response OmpR family regulator